MSESKTKSWFATIIAVCSIIISGASFYLSYQTQQLSQAETMSVAVVASIDDLPIIISIRPGRFRDVLVEAPFKVIFSNNGNRKLSIVRFRVWEIDERGQMSNSYTGLDSGFWDSHDKPLNLPITLDTGQSEIIYVRLGLTPGDLARKVLLTKFPSGGKVSRMELYRILGKQYTDLYDNVASPEGMTYRPEEIKNGRQRLKLRRQLLELNFRTGKGNEFSATTHWPLNPFWPSLLAP